MANQGLVDPDMPALLDLSPDAPWTTKQDDCGQSATYHSNHHDIGVDLNALMSGPDMHVRRRHAFDWDAFVPFYIELEKFAVTSPNDFAPFNVEIEKLVTELAPDDQVREKLLKELISQTP